MHTYAADILQDTHESWKSDLRSSGDVMCGIQLIEHMSSMTNHMKYMCTNL